MLYLAEVAHLFVFFVESKTSPGISTNVKKNFIFSMTFHHFECFCFKKLTIIQISGIFRETVIKKKMYILPYPEASIPKCIFSSLLSNLAKKLSVSIVYSTFYFCNTFNAIFLDSEVIASFIFGYFCYTVALAYQGFFSSVFSKKAFSIRAHTFHFFFG